MSCFLILKLSSKIATLIMNYHGFKFNKYKSSPDGKISALKSIPLLPSTFMCIVLTSFSSVKQFCSMSVQIFVMPIII